MKLEDNFREGIEMVTVTYDWLMMAMETNRILYHNLLGRDIDNSGMAACLASEINEGWTAEDVSAWIQESDEYKSKQNQPDLPGLGSIDDILFPSKDELRNFRGNLCSYISGLSLPDSRELGGERSYPKDLLFTPAYVIYDEVKRKEIRTLYKLNFGPHFPINCRSIVSIYHDFFPAWDESLINRYLLELWSDGMIPVCSVLADNDTTFNPHLDSRLVKIAFWWEDSNPIRRPELDENNKFHLVKQQYPEALIYWHNPTGQGAPYVNAAEWGRKEGDEVNSLVWHYMVDVCGVQGLLFQGNGWDYKKDANGNNIRGTQGVPSIERLGDFDLRLGHGKNGWPKCDLVDFEETAYPLTWYQMKQKEALDLAHMIRGTYPGLTGYCSG